VKRALVSAENRLLTPLLFSLQYLDTMSDMPHFSLRSLLIWVAIIGVVLGLASLGRNLVWWLLLVLAFYGPFALCCIFVKRSAALVLAVVALHSAVILAIPLAFRMSFGNVDEVTHAAAIAFIDAPMLPIYLAIDVGPQTLVALSLSAGNIIFSVIAIALRRLTAGHDGRNQVGKRSMRRVSRRQR
jgi:hypothetical protein